MGERKEKKKLPFWILLISFNQTDLKFELSAANSYALSPDVRVAINGDNINTNLSVSDFEEDVFCLERA